MTPVHARRERTLLVVIALLAGLVVAQVGGILTAVGGASLASAFVAGGVSFAGAVTLTLAVERALGLL